MTSLDLVRLENPPDHFRPKSRRQHDVSGPPGSTLLCMNFSGHAGRCRESRSAPHSLPAARQALASQPRPGETCARAGGGAAGAGIMMRFLVAARCASGSCLLRGARLGPRLGQSHLRHQLARRGRAWRLLSGPRRWHLRQIRARRDDPAGRPADQQSPAAGRRAHRFRHGRQHDPGVQLGRAERADRRRRFACFRKTRSS